MAYDKSPPFQRKHSHSSSEIIFTISQVDERRQPFLVNLSRSVNSHAQTSPLGNKNPFDRNLRQNIPSNSVNHNEYFKHIFQKKIIKENDSVWRFVHYKNVKL